MTNEEIIQIIRMQREAKAHHEAVPGALAQAKLMIARKEAEEAEDVFSIGLESHTLRTLVKEVERLQAALKQANQDARDEEREARHSAGAAYAEGRHDGIEESRGY
jgi:predicted RNA-binding protein with PIN domain